eukprot:gene32145-41679_t
MYFLLLELILVIGFFQQVISSSSDVPPPPGPALRAIHASADTQPVDIYFNGTKILSSIGFGKASPFLSVPLGNAAIKVTYAGKDKPILDGNVILATKSWFSALAFGSSVQQGNEKLQVLVITDLANAPATGKYKIRVVHAAVSIPFVDVYAVAPEVKIADSKPVIKNLGFGQSAPASGELALELPVGTYVLYLAAAGTTIEVYQSPVLPVSGGDFLVAAVLSGEPVDKKSVKLLVADVNGESWFLNPQ